MAGERKLTVVLAGDASHLKTAFKEGENAAHGFGGKLGGLVKPFGDVAKIAGGFVIGGGLLKLPGALMGLSDTARDLELQMKKATTVFGDQLPEVQKWAAGNAAAMGLTKSGAVNLAAGLQDLLVPMGMTREAAAAMATKTIGLSGALAEWSGGAKSAAEVADILTKAYLGETDGLKALGISISAADVAARLAEKGQAKLTGTALQQAQALAIQEMAFEKSTDAQKAFADGADSAARKKALMTARIQEAKDALANALAPAFTAVTTAGAGLVTKVLPPLVEGFEFVADKAGNFVAPALERVRDAALAISGVAWDAAKAPFDLAWPSIQAAWEAINEAAVLFGKVAWGAAADAWERINAAVGGVDWGAVGGKASELAGQAGDLGSYAAAWEAVKKGVQPFVAIFGPQLKMIWGDLSKAGKDLATEFGPLAKAVGELVKAFEPMEPLLVPIVALIGIGLLVAIEMLLLPITALAKALSLTLGPALQGVTWTIENVVTPAVKEIGVVFTAVSIVVATVARDVARTVSELAGGIEKAMGEVVSKVASAAGWIDHYLRVAAGYFDTFEDLVMWPIRRVKEAIQELIDLIGKIPSPGGIAGGVLGKVGGAAGALGGALPLVDSAVVPRFAAGGIVRRPTLALIGEAGPEAVIPLSPGSGVAAPPATVIHVHIGTVIGDSDEWLRRTDRRLRRMGLAGILPG